eukprot:4808659-Pyramimonas_sp.AAC.1
MHVHIYKGRCGWDRIALLLVRGLRMTRVRFTHHEGPNPCISETGSLHLVVIQLKCKGEFHWSMRRVVNMVLSGDIRAGRMSSSLSAKGTLVKTASASPAMYARTSEYAVPKFITAT